ncbi:hypothetical protein [Thalassoroseus pseudoceratinae]|nr:hypothetical protein [Thalassoroseus pseudoceratinae]
MFSRGLRRLQKPTYGTEGLASVISGSVIFPASPNRSMNAFRGG